MTSALADANYVVVTNGCFNTTSATNGNDFVQAANFTTTTFDLGVKVSTSGAVENISYIGVSVFR